MTQTKPESTTRRGRFVRSVDPRALRPLATIEQAEAILTLLDRHLFLTNDQVETALFRTGLTQTGKVRAAKGAAYAANTALRRLFDGGWVDRVPVFLPGATHETVKPHFVNVLTTQGAREARRVLAERGRAPRWRRSLLPHPWQPLLHDFWIREFAIRTAAAVAAAGYAFGSWFDDRQLAGLKKEHGATYRTVPDGFFVVTNPVSGKAFPHFLEIDLGTQTGKARSPDRPDWRGKVASYRDYFARDFREQFGVATLPVVLTITSAARRLANLLAVTGGAGGAGRFWFTTLDDWTGRAADDGGCAGLEGPLRAAIWRTPAEGRLRSLAGRYAPLGRDEGTVSRGSARAGGGGVTA